MLNGINETEIRLVLEAAARIYASRRVENISLPQFDDVTQDIRKGLVTRWFCDEGESEKSPSAFLYMLLDEAKKYTELFYDAALDFSSIIESVSLARNRKLISRQP